MVSTQRAVVILWSVVITLIATGCQSSGPNIVGKWSGNFQGQVFTAEFTDKGTCTLTAIGQTVNCTYTIDMTTKPIQLNLDGKEIGKAETIVEFIDASTLRLNLDDTPPGSPRPTTFGIRTATLTKQ